MLAPRSLSLILALVASAALVACSSSSYEMEIEPSLVNCTGVGPTLCLHTTVDGETRYMHSSIEGFEFEWCKRARLLVREEPVLNPPADGSSIRYILDDVIEQVEVPGHEMTLTIFDAWQLSDGEITALDFVPRCHLDDTEPCDQLRAALEDPTVDRVEATFLCEEGEAVPLLIDVVEPAD